MKEVEKCLLCGSPSKYGGIFIPSDPKLWGATKRYRRIWYGLCARCFFREDTKDGVEKVLWSELRPGIQFPEFKYPSTESWVTIKK